MIPAEIVMRRSNDGLRGQWGGPRSRYQAA